MSTTDSSVKVCVACGREYQKASKVAPSQWAKSRFCSRQCAASRVRGKSDIRPDEATLRNLYESQRLTTHQIGEQYGVPHISVCRWLRFYGIERRPSGNGLAARGIANPTPEELRCLVHEKHLSYRKIAEIFGVDLTAVPYWLRKFGIERPEAWTTRRKGIVPQLPDADTLLSLYRNGLSLAKIGKRFGVSGGVVSKLFDQYGIAKKRTSPPDAETLEPMYESGLTLEEIGEKLGYTASRIGRLLQDYGIERRPAGFNGGRRYTCNNGEIVLSVYEQRVCNWLHAHSVLYVYEPTLPWGRRCRADFLANGWYIEIWGVTGFTYPQYKARKERKLEMYKNFNLPLIQIFRKTFYARTDMLSKRLSRCLTPLENLPLFKLLGDQ